MDKNRIRFKHILYFLGITLPIYCFSILSYVGIIAPINVIVLLCTQCISLSLWLMYTSIVPSLHGEVRIKLRESPETFNDYTTSVTTRSSFMTFSIACLALIGVALFNKEHELTSSFLFSGVFFSVSIILFIISLDVHDTAKNPPFNNSSGTQNIFRRGAPTYQIGQSFIVCGLVSGLYIIHSLLCISVAYIWVIVYMTTNLSTKRIEGYIWQRYIYIIIFFFLAFAPILYLNGVWKNIDFFLFLSYILIFLFFCFAVIAIPFKITPIHAENSLKNRILRFLPKLKKNCKIFYRFICLLLCVALKRSKSAFDEIFSYSKKQVFNLTERGKITAKKYIYKMTQYIQRLRQIDKDDKKQ